MKDRIKNSLVFLFIVILLALNPSCKSEINPDQETDSRPPINSQDAINLIYNNLEQIDGTTDIELTIEQRKAFRSELISAVEKEGISTSNDLPKIMSVLTGSAFEAIGIIDQTLSDSEKIYIMQDVLGSQAEFIKDRVSGDEAIIVFEKMSQSAINQLELLNLDATSKQEAIEKISFCMIKSVGDIPLGGKSVKDVATVIVKNMVSYSGKQGWDENDRYIALNATLKGALEGLAAAGLNLDAYGDAIAQVVKTATKEATANEISSGKDQNQLISSMNDIANNSLDAMVAAGVTTATCSDMASDIISGAAEELTSVLNAEQLNEALITGVNGIENGLDQAGATTEEKASAVESGNKAAKDATDNAATEAAFKLKISDEKLMTTEGSEENGSFKISLDKEATEPVTVNIISRDESEGTVSPATLVIDAENWNKPQLVTILPQDDWIVDDEISYSIILKTNGELTKTLVVKNQDNDKVGIKITPTKDQYSSEVGGQAHYRVSLTSKPRGDIRLRWAITSGSDSIFFNPNSTRIQNFTSLNYFEPQLIVIQGQVCGDCQEHASASIKSQNIISVDGKDRDYPELTPSTISLTNLKGGPIIKTTDIVDSRTVGVNFDGSQLNFSNDDDNFIYETVFATEYITMTYAKYQERPLLIKEGECFNGQSLDWDVDSATTTTGNPPVTTTTYSFTFCLKFYNANTSQTSAGMGRWASSHGFTRNSCTGNGAALNYVTCRFSGSGSSPPSLTITANTIFSGNKIGNSAYSLNGGGYHTSLPNIPALNDVERPAVNLKYDKLSIKGSRTADFVSDSDLLSGYWYLSDKSKSFVLGSSTYSSSNYYYIYVP